MISALADKDLMLPVRAIDLMLGLDSQDLMLSEVVNDRKKEIEGFWLALELLAWHFNLLGED